LRFFALHSLDLLAIHQEDKKMSKFKTLLKTALTPIALCLSIALVSPALAKNSHHQKHDGMRQVLSGLSLTDTQKQDIRQVLKQTREDRGLFSSDAKSLKTELRNLIQSTEWDQTAIESAIAQNQTLIIEKALQRASNKNKVWNLLTETQQAEFVVLKADLETRKAERKEKSKGKRKAKRGHNRLKRLDLTEEQLTAVDGIKTVAKTNGEATKVKLKTFRQAERFLIQSTDFSAEAWQTLSSEYQTDFLAIAVLKAKVRHDIWNLLTPEQQAAAEEEGRGKKGKKNKKRQQLESI
jgi:Spy/CpxP family protein refolding chaperone